MSFSFNIFSSNKSVQKSGVEESEALLNQSQKKPANNSAFVDSLKEMGKKVITLFKSDDKAVFNVNNVYQSINNSPEEFSKELPDNTYSMKLSDKIKSLINKIKNLFSKKVDSTEKNNNQADQILSGSKAPAPGQEEEEDFGLEELFGENSTPPDVQNGAIPTSPLGPPMSSHQNPNLELRKAPTIPPVSPLIPPCPIQQTTEASHLPHAPFKPLDPPSSWVPQTSHPLDEPSSSRVVPPTIPLPSLPPLVPIPSQSSVSTTQLPTSPPSSQPSVPISKPQVPPVSQPLPPLPQLPIPPTPQPSAPESQPQPLAPQSSQSSTSTPQPPAPPSSPSPASPASSPQVVSTNNSQVAPQQAQGPRSIDQIITDFSTITDVSKHSSQEALSSILKDLRSIHPNDANDITIEAVLEKKATLYVNPHNPKEPNYQIEVTYKFISKSKNLQLNKDLYKIPPLTRDLKTTCSTREETILLATEYKNTIVDLAISFATNTPTGRIKTVNPNLLNNKEFQFDFATDASGIPTVLNGISGYDGNQNVKLEIALKEKDQVYLYDKNSDSGSYVKQKDLDNFDPEQYEKYDSEVQQILGSAKSYDVSYSAYYKTFETDSKEMKNHINDLKKEIEKKEAEFADVKKKFYEKQSLMKTFLRKKGDAETPTFKQYIAFGKYAKDDTKMDGLSPDMQQYARNRTALALMELETNGTKQDKEIRKTQMNELKNEMVLLEDNISKEQVEFHQELSHLQQINDTLKEKRRELDGFYKEAKIRLNDENNTSVDNIKTANMVSKEASTQNIAKLDEKIKSNQVIIDKVKERLDLLGANVRNQVLTLSIKSS